VKIVFEKCVGIIALSHHISMNIMFLIFGTKVKVLCCYHVILNTSSWHKSLLRTQHILCIAVKGWRSNLLREVPLDQFVAYFLFLRKKPKFMRTPCCVLCVCVCTRTHTLFNFWTSWPSFMNFGMNIILLEDTPTSYILISYNH